MPKNASRVKLKAAKAAGRPPSTATMAATTAVQRERSKRQAEPDGFWQRWWPFAFALPAPTRQQLVTKESSKRRRDRIKKLRKYDEGRDFEQFTDSYQGDSSGSLGPEEGREEAKACPESPDTPAGHYSKAHPLYKKLRLPSGRRVDITKRNYFLRKWRDKKVKTSYYAFYVLFALLFVVLLVIYAYTKNMPWLYKILSGLRDVAQGTKGAQRKSTAPYSEYPFLKAESSEEEEDGADENDGTDYATETRSDARGARDVVFEKDDMRK